MSTRRPSFPTYVSDWLGNSAVRLLSPELRGILADLKCLAHDGEPYGTLTHASGRELTPEEIARITSTELDLIRGGIRALLEARLLGRSRGSGKLFVPDMVHREEVRQRRAAGGVRSIEHPNVAKPKQLDLMDTLNGYPSRVSTTEKTSSVVSSHLDIESPEEGKSDEKGREPYTPEFESAWMDYPKRAGTNSKVDAFKSWLARCREAGDTETGTKVISAMTQGVARYALFCTATGKLGTETVMTAERFFGRSKHYLSEYEIPATNGHEPPAAQMFVNSQEALRDL
jgi:hypothetical protein